MTYPGEKYKDLSIGEKCEDFSKWWKCKKNSKWSYYNGQPTQEKNIMIFKVVKNVNIFQSGFIVMGDLPRWKDEDFFSGEKF